FSDVTSQTAGDYHDDDDYDDDDDNDDDVIMAHPRHNDSDHQIHRSPNIIGGVVIPDYTAEYINNFKNWNNAISPKVELVTRSINKRKCLQPIRYYGRSSLQAESQGTYPNISPELSGSRGDVTMATSSDVTA